MYKQEAGTLYVGITKASGKLVDEWKFLSPFKNKKAPQLVVQVSIDKSKKDHILFVARGDCLAVDYQDTDIERLRRTVEAALRHQHDLLTGVHWEDWLEVEVCGGTRNDSYWKSQDSALSITYRPIKRGVDPVTGTPYVINSNGLAMPFPKPKRAGELDEGDKVEEFLGMNRREQDAEFSYLPATAENVAALDELMSRLQALRGKLSEFLSQGSVQQSLVDLTSRMPSLPAPL
jgi:hypothetical protein